MIVDRITLVLAYIYLDNFRAFGGEVDSILILKENKFRNSTKTLAKMNMNELGDYIQNIAPITTKTNVERNCIDQCLYSLRSFNFTIDGATRFIEYRDGFGWIAKDADKINAMQFSQLSEYTKKLNGVRRIYDELYIDEYIRAQTDYIDCGYIQQMFSSAIEEILQLYNTYKTY